MENGTAEDQQFTHLSHSLSRGSAPKQAFDLRLITRLADLEIEMSVHDGPLHNLVSKFGEVMCSTVPEDKQRGGDYIGSATDRQAQTTRYTIGCKSRVFDDESPPRPRKI
ncbi:hypothetical protein N7540_012256 [Penicillium herquei]|nr:hypothetical protein N7540_012256 [Penicillium herquei]